MDPEEHVDNKALQKPLISVVDSVDKVEDEDVTNPVHTKL